LAVLIQRKTLFFGDILLKITLSAHVILSNMKKEEIRVFTDGASRGNPGPGGWGAIIELEEDVYEIGGRNDRTTNNRMELTAIVETLESLESKGNTSSKVHFLTDSSYVANGINSWINGWRRNSWKNKSGDEIANIDLWQKLDGHLNIFEVFAEHVAAHVGVPANERVDEIATTFADNDPTQLFNGKKFLYKIDLKTTQGDSDKKEAKKRNVGKAFSYLSLVDGELQIHKTWPECEKRVKGKKGVKFKKALSQQEEDQIRIDWGV
jgi:ribonuclease HI